MFLDRVKIQIKAGNGGNGVVSFLRNAQTMKGGPDGGDGGKGGDVIFLATDDLNTLYNFRFKKKFVAQSGENGYKKLQTGKSGEDLIIKVPTGTVLIDPNTNKVIADLYENKMQFVALKGGEGGRGNAYFKSSVRQAPSFSKLGETTDLKEVILELKTIADVGLVGYPNVGKSTLLSCISNANPKIANYPFTTLYPNLGVVEVLGETYVVADIPGLIEGASEGQGLGHYFLKHVERVRLIVHLIDISEQDGRNIFDDYEVINRELQSYSEELVKTPQIVVFTKCDLIDEEEKNKKIAEFKDKFKVKLPILEISSITYSGIEELKKKVLEELSKIPKKPPLLVEEFDFDKKDRSSINIEVVDDVYVVSGGLIQSLSRGVILSDPLSFAYFQNKLKELGIIDMLKENGMENGDTVRIKDIEFVYEE